MTLASWPSIWDMQWVGKRKESKQRKEEHKDCGDGPSVLRWWQDYENYTQGRNETLYKKLTVCKKTN